MGEKRPQPLGWMAGLSRMLLAQEAIGSVSLSHEQSCRCDVCKAALGDGDALGRVIDGMSDPEEQG